MRQNGRSKRYLELNQKYLNDAERLLKENDLSQASEKLWGAIATLTKAIAATRNKQIKSHDGITFFLTTIANELKDQSIIKTIFVANGLHQNFYENTLTVETVRYGAKVVKQLSKRLRVRFNLG